jgi:hypothetical protein
MFNREQVKIIFSTYWWQGWPARDIALVQLSQDQLITPYSVFMTAVEQTVGYGLRPGDLESKRWNLLGEINEGKMYAFTDPECLAHMPTFVRHCIDEKKPMEKKDAVKS